MKVSDGIKAAFEDLKKGDGYCGACGKPVTQFNITEGHNDIMLVCGCGSGSKIVVTDDIVVDGAFRDKDHTPQKPTVKIHRNKSLLSKG